MGHPVTLEGRFRGERHRKAPKGLPASPTAPKPQKPEKIPLYTKNPQSLCPIAYGRLIFIHLPALEVYKNQSPSLAGETDTIHT